MDVFNVSQMAFFWKVPTGPDYVTNQINTKQTLNMSTIRYILQMQILAAAFYSP